MARSHGLRQKNERRLVKPQIRNDGWPADPVHAPPPGAHAEVELKLLVEAGALEQLRQAPVIARNARNQGVVRRMDAIYYDTPDRALHSRGLSLRVRRSGRRYTQTLKRTAPGGGNIARQEWETPVDNATPDLARLPPADIAELLNGCAVDALVPIFTTKVRRRTQCLDMADTVVEVAFDEGTIEVGGRREPLSEIELELKGGDASVLYGIGSELLDITPLRVGVASKSDRGYALAFDLVPEASKAPSPEVTAEHTVDDAIAIILGGAQQHLLANQAVAEDGRNPDGVHQMRVALRRLRAALALFRREMDLPSVEAFNTEAKWLGEKLGAARNWDVLITTGLSAPAQACAGDVNFDPLRAAAEPHRGASYAALREALADARYNRFQLSLAHWIERRGWRNDVSSEALGILSEPAPARAGRVLTKLQGKALKRGEHFRRLAPPSRHKLRIALKNLRYAAEFFQAIYAEQAASKRYLAQLSKLQDALGQDHDATSTRPLLEAIGGASGAPELHRAIGALIGWQARDRAVAAEALRKRWRQLKDTPAYWRD